MADDIAHTEFCNRIFAPVITTEGKKSLTMVAKPARLLLKFHGVKRSSIKNGNVKQYVYDNLFAIKDELKFYPGFFSYHEFLNKNSSLQANKLEEAEFKAGSVEWEVDYNRWK